MRVACLLSSNLFSSPYVRYYTQIMESQDVRYDLFTWNRFNKEEEGVQSFDLPVQLGKNIIGKMIDSFRYCRYLQSELQKKRYDKLVIFTLQNALMLEPLLKKKYAGKYIVDIRDYSVILNLLKYRLRSSISRSAFSVLSSKGYQAWLPKNYNYIIRHNTADVNLVPLPEDLMEYPKINILTIGAIGYYDANRNLIEQLANEMKFELKFVGSGYADQKLKDFVNSRNIQNVKFHGKYDKPEEAGFLEGATLISILTDDSMNSRTCMANRFYLSCIHGIPMMVNAGTEMANLAIQYNLGIAIDKNKNMKDQILDFYSSFDRKKFEDGRKEYMFIVQRDNVGFETHFRTFLQT